MDPTTIAAAANEAARGCRYPAPRLFPDSSPESIRAWLIWNDPNGEYSRAFDEDHGGAPTWATLADVLAAE